MAKIERDANGKTRVAKGDKSGLGGQYAPDVELLKRHALKVAEFAKTFQESNGNPLEVMTVREYDEAAEAVESLHQHYDLYNKEQQTIFDTNYEEPPVSDGDFTYFPVFSADNSYTGLSRTPRNSEGQPAGWTLRVGDQYSSTVSGLGYYATREEALNAVEVMKASRLSNPYVKEQSSKYDVEYENREATALQSSAPKGPWVMKLKFIEPKPNVSNPKENGYHSGWCLIVESDQYQNGAPVFVSPQGYATREEAVEAKNLVLETMKGWEGKDRVIFAEGSGNIPYNNMSSEQYEKVVNNYGFKPRPWAASDEYVNYYPDSSYQGD